MDPELARFYEAWVPVLRGASEVADCLRTLGGSRSSLADLAFYRVLAERNAAAILGALYPATRAHVIQHFPGRWLLWAQAYERRASSAHWDPNEWGRDFAPFVAGIAEQEGTAGAFIEELADYEWVHYALGAGVAPESLLAAPDTEPPTFVIRQYDHDVPRMVQQARLGVLPPTPTPSPRVVIVYRDAGTGYPRVCYPSRAALLVLARRVPNCKSFVTTETEPQALLAAEQELVVLGVLAAEPRA